MGHSWINESKSPIYSTVDRFIANKVEKYVLTKDMIAKKGDTDKHLIF